MIDKKILLAVVIVLLILLLTLAIGNYCGAPSIVNQSAGDMRMACLFPWPWSVVFGIGMQIYNFNIFVCAGIPALLLILWLLSTFRRDR